MDTNIFFLHHNKQTTVDQRKSNLQSYLMIHFISTYNAELYLHIISTILCLHTIQKNVILQLMKNIYFPVTK